MSDFEAFQRSVLETVRLIGSKFDKPDDEWHTVYILSVPQSKGTIRMVIEIQGVMSNAESKTFVANVAVPDLIRQHHVEYCALVMPGWASSNPITPDALDRGDFVRPKDSPQRREVLLVTAMSRDRVDMNIAKVTRCAGAAPTLGEWETHADNGDPIGLMLRGPWLALKEVDAASSSAVDNLVRKALDKIDGVDKL